MIRVLALLAMLLLGGAGLAVHELAGGALQQNGGTALYAAVVYAAVVVVAPRTPPLVTGAVALGLCWLVELAQLTGGPAALSARSTVARLLLGASFDWTDMAWYPAGVVPLVVIELLWGSPRRVT